VKQGDMEAMFHFCISINMANEILHASTHKKRETQFSAILMNVQELPSYESGFMM